MGSQSFEGHDPGTSATPGQSLPPLPPSAIRIENIERRTDILLAEDASSSHSASAKACDGPIWYQIDPPSSSVELREQGFDARATLAGDGRVNVKLDQKAGWLSEHLAGALPGPWPGDEPPAYHIVREADQLGPRTSRPSMSVVIQIVGSRGDVQPFLALAKALKRTHGHQVRMATHPKFKALVEEEDIEFFSIGGDPAELMEYMVENPGLLPSVDGLLNGSVSRKKDFIAKILQGCWSSCVEPSSNGKPFVADAIIANPPSFAHIHCAERLGIPLHLMFTMPWTPSQAFSHPFAHIQSTNAEPSMTNYMSFHLVEMMMWQGLGKIINRFRTQTLKLEPINLLFAPGLVCRLKIPITYCWSPALLPQPRDWGSHISISGYFEDLSPTTYIPPADLSNFLEGGPPPVYIGFGSIPLDNAAAITNLILEAVASIGVRAIISVGWARLGAALTHDEIPENVLFINDLPHSWLFPRCAAVVHHGGAGTTAAGLALGRPTVIVPFFGDQFFWGEMVARRGAGPAPVPFRQLTSARLAEAIAFTLKPSVMEVAREIMESISGENGVEMGVAHFHGELEIGQGFVRRCAAFPDRVAVWKLKETSGRGKEKAHEDSYFSALGAVVLAQEGLINLQNLALLRPREYDTTLANAPWDPISSLMTETFSTVSDVLHGIADGPSEAYRQVRKAKARKSETQTGAGQEVNPTPPTPNSLSRTHTSSSSASVSNPYGAVALSSAKAIPRIAGAGLKTPVTFTHGLTRGFHNVPRLYGDDTVRKEDKIDGVGSGLVAAGKGFGLGLYDGLTGFVMQPVNGAQKEGAVGFLKGFGKGLGGVVFKPAAGACGVPGYTFMGVYKSLQKLRTGKTPLEAYLITSRVAQGEEEALTITETERQDVVGRWSVLASQRGYAKTNRRS